MAIIPNSWCQSRIDSLLRDVATAPIESRPDIYIDLFVATLDSSNQANHFAILAEEISLKLGDSINYVRALYAQGYIQKSNSNYERAIVLYSKALRTSRNIGFKEREKVILNSLGLLYYELSKFDLSLKFYLESLALREDESDKKGIAIAANNIGLVYYQLNDFNKALIYFDRALTLKSELGQNINGINVNIGLANIGIRQYERALISLNNVISSCDDGCDISTLIEAFDSRGICLLELEMLNEAESDLRKALSLADLNGYDDKKASILTTLANILIAKESYDHAKSYLDSSQYYALRQNKNIIIKQNYQYYAELAYKQGDFQSAYEYRVKYDSVSNEIMNEVLAKNLLQVQVDYEERENLEVIALKDKELSRRTTLLFLSLAVAVLTALIVLILYKNNLSRRRVNVKLHRANETIARQNDKLTELNTELEERVKHRTEELRQSNVALLKSNHDLDNFIYKTSHDIRGPLATLQGICNIALMDVKEPMAVDYLRKLSKTAHKLNEILSKLLIINQINNMLPSLDRVNILRIIEQLVEQNRMAYYKKDIHVTLDIEPLESFQSDEGLLKIIFGNIINNAFKFHNPSESVNSEIIIRSFKKDDGLIFRVTDNGVGITPNIRQHIFDIFSKTSELHDSAGMGLYLVQLATAKLDGKVAVNIDQSGNTVFEVLLPIEVSVDQQCQSTS